VLGQNQLGPTLEIIKTADVKFVALALFCGVLSHLARALRWNLLLKPMGYKATIAGSFHSVIIGYLLNTVGGRLGEVARPAMLSKLEKIPFNKLVGTIVTERIIDMLITLLIAISIFFLQFNTIKDLILGDGDGSYKTIIFIGVLIAGIIGLVVFYKLRHKIYQLAIFKKFKNFIEGVFEGIKSIFSMDQKGLFIFYSLFIWAMYFCMPYFILFALEGTAHLGLSAGLTVLFFGTAAMIVPTPGGIGTFEIAVPAALALYGIGKTVGDAYTILTHSLQIIIILAIGIISVIYYVVKSQQLKKK
jgi:uncharacterized protein (TIRG00374 family)